MTDEKTEYSQKVSRSISNMVNYSLAGAGSLFFAGIGIGAEMVYSLQYNSETPQVPLAAFGAGMITLGIAFLATGICEGVRTRDYVLKNQPTQQATPPPLPSELEKTVQSIDLEQAQ